MKFGSLGQNSFGANTIKPIKPIQPIKPQQIAVKKAATVDGLKK